MHSILLAFALFAPLTPTIVAQPLVVLSLFLLIINRFNSYTLNSYLRFKLITTALFSFGIFNTLIFEPSQLIRFIPILYLIWFYPYFCSYPLNPGILKKISLVIIIAMVLSQILLAFQEPFITQFRDTFYPIKEDVWRERAYFSRLTTDAFTIFRGFRLGGFWYNPNVYAANLFLVYLVFYSTSKYLISISEIINQRNLRNSFIGGSFLVFLSLLSSGSRSFIVAFFLMILINNQKYFLNLTRFKGSIFSSLIFTLGILFTLSINFFASLVEGFSEGGSFDIKLSILKDYYLDSADIISLLTGSGVIDFPFDFEYSYWFVLGGIFALVGLMIFYIRISRLKTSSFYYLCIPLLFAGLGTSILFGLMTASLLIPVFIVVYNFDMNKSPFID